MRKPSEEIETLKDMGKQKDEEDVKLMEFLSDNTNKISENHLQIQNLLFELEKVDHKIVDQDK